jgi:biopolymer transport protein ExbD
MAGLASSKPGAPITGINVTPLVDITLVLLIIFMVTAKLVMSKAMPMDLPQASAAREVQSPLTLTLAADGRVYTDGSLLPSDDAIVDRAKAALAGQRDLRTIVEADGAVPHRRVIHVLDVLRRSGVVRVAFAVQATNPSDEGP